MRGRVAGGTRSLLLRGGRLDAPLVAAVGSGRMTGAGRWVYPRGVIDPPGEIEQPRAPLRLYERGIWDPAEQYWGEPDGMLELCLVEVIAAGPRLPFELEQLLPGGEDPDARPDPGRDGAARSRAPRSRPGAA